jgi:hypothetical protein
MTRARTPYRLSLESSLSWEDAEGGKARKIDYSNSRLGTVDFAGFVAQPGRFPQISANKWRVASVPAKAQPPRVAGSGWSGHRVSTGPAQHGGQVGSPPTAHTGGVSMPRKYWRSGNLLTGCDHPSQTGRDTKQCQGSKQATRRSRGPPSTQWNLRCWHLREMSGSGTTGLA